MWCGRADTHSQGTARGGGATPVYPLADSSRYSNSYGRRVADGCRYTVSNSNGDVFPCAPFAHPDAHANGYPDADALAETDAGSHADAPIEADASSHIRTDLTSEGL